LEQATSLTPHEDLRYYQRTIHTRFRAGLEVKAGQRREAPFFSLFSSGQGCLICDIKRICRVLSQYTHCIVRYNTTASPCIICIHPSAAKKLIHTTRPVGCLPPCLPCLTLHLHVHAPKQEDEQTGCTRLSAPLPLPVPLRLPLAVNSSPSPNVVSSSSGATTNPLLSNPYMQSRIS